MYIQLDVFRLFVMNWVGRHVHARDVVAEHHCGFVDVAPEFAEKLAEPDALSCYICHRSVFGLGTGARYRWLAFQRPRDEGVAEVDAEARGGSPGVGAAALICIRVHRNGAVGGRAEKNAVRRRATYVAQMRFRSAMCGCHGSCMYRHTCCTAWAMSGRVIVRYWSAPARLR